MTGARQSFSNHWSPLSSVLVFVAAFCVYSALLASVFFVFGGFVLILFKKYLVFSLMVAVPAVALSFFVALVAAFQTDWPSPIAEFELRKTANHHSTSSRVDSVSLPVK